MRQRDRTVVVFGEALVEESAGAQPIVGGAPFNVARHLAAFMAAPLLITRIGQDRNGERVRAECERFVIPQSGVQLDPIEETGRVLVERGIAAQGGAPRRTIPPQQACDFIDARAALASLADPATIDAIYFGTLAQRGEASRAALAAILETRSARRFLDLNLYPGQAAQVDEALVTRALTLADVAKVNEAELQMLFGWYFGIGPGSAPLAAGEVHAACRALVDRFALEGLVVTLGHRGSVYFGADGGLIAHRDNPAPPFVIDSAGAGDAFAAIFLLGRLRGWPLAPTLARANAFAGAICTVPGAVPRDMGFYEGWEARWRAEPV